MKILLVNTVINRGSVGRITADLYREIEASGNEAILGIGRRTTRTVTAIKKINRILADVQVVHLPFVYIQYFL